MPVSGGAGRKWEEGRKYKYFEWKKKKNIYIYLNCKHLLNIYAHHSLEELEPIMCFHLSGAP